MPETNIAYATDVPIVVTAWGTGLAAGEFATSAIFNNTTTLLMDLLLGGVLQLDATTPVAGDTLDIYIAGQYSETVEDMGGGIDALFNAANEEVEDTGFVLANLTQIRSISVEAAVPATAQGYHWGPVGVAQFFGGIMPKRLMLILHNNTEGTMAAGSNVNATGITYITA